MNLEQRLEQVFHESFQVKRVIKEIQYLREAKPSMGMQFRICLLGQIHLTLYVQILQKKLKQIKKLSFMNKLQFKIVLSNGYPASAPELYFMLQNSIVFGINPYYNYLNALIPDWNLKYSMLKVVESVPAFLIKCIEKTQPIQGQPILNSYFELDKMYNDQGCPTFLVQFIRSNTYLKGLLVIVNGIEVILFEKTNVNGSYSISDFIKISEVTSVQKHKTKQIRCMLEIKRSRVKLAVQFDYEQYEKIVDAIAEIMKANSLIEKYSDQGSDSSDDEGIINRQLQSQNQELVITDRNIKQVQSQITILQSLVDDKPTAGNIKDLVDFLKKTVEYYSQKGDKRCQTYLRTLQDIMSNQFMQALLASQNGEKKTYEKKEYQSIADLV